RAQRARPAPTGARLGVRRSVRLALHADTALVSLSSDDRCDGTARRQPTQRAEGAERPADRHHEAKPGARNRVVRPIAMWARTRNRALEIRSPRACPECSEPSAQNPIAA